MASRRSSGGSGKPSFSSLQFGFISSEQEYADDPSFLIDGFYDQHHAVDQVERGDKWLILGPKGAGKSAISERIRLLAAERDDWYARKLELEDFPFVDLDQINVGGATRGSRLPAVWTYLLCVQILASLEEDEGFNQASNDDIHKLVKILRRAQLIPDPEPKGLLFRLKSASVKAKPPWAEFGVEGDFAAGDGAFYQAVDSLKSAIAKVDVDALHFILIDGLDTLSVGEDEETKWQVLTALVKACDKLSRLFRENNTPVRLALLCRDDLFYRIGYADSNKILGGSAETINWFPESRRPEDTELFDLAERKAAVHSRPIGDIVQDYLPAEIRIGGNRWEIRDYLLQHTRFLPRDFLQLLTYIAKHSPTNGLPGMNAVIDGAKDYAQSYFIEEIRSGIIPVFGRRVSNIIMDALSVLPGSSFKLSALKKFLYEDLRYRELDLIELMNSLHRLGVVGNLVSVRGRQSVHNFIYHNPRSKIELNGTITLHNAAIQGFGLERKSL
ncbi:P-loop ATPase, Sll1717 family [Amycolatopsis sp. NPDC049252]|uniref:P-loop ATPase, Sll1717 family n=1 Tax=Amycolatopsis sp. NPDC049252 TaxID=3363933 RepID=UPI00371B8AFB